MSKNRMENEAQTSQPNSDMVATAEEMEESMCREEKANLVADIVAHVPEAYCFDG